MTTPVTLTRWEAVSGPFGLAALRHTHWLDSTPRSLDGVSGLWWADASTVHGRDVDALGAVDVAAFDEVQAGRLRLRAFARDGAFALRVYDPESPSRTSLRAIEAYPPDESWVLSGRFVAAPDAHTVTVRSIDGYEKSTPAVGTVEVDVEGEQVRLQVERVDAGLWAVITDATADDGAYRFRFLPLPAPDHDDLVRVDFNAAYLPPCAFSDHYVCPLPPRQNRISAAITAGERRAVRG